MCRVRVDQDRRKTAQKRGGDRLRLDAVAVEPMIEPPVENVLGPDETLKEPAATDARQAQKRAAFLEVRP
ncbi:MAG: hypothetical protein BroJett003_09080 [Planctomycetota bacterium]|nr:MAG: hypothetical protein BroJett003_09080 [Planctomycetota bacterium]